MSIEILDLSNVLVDGQNAGYLPDVLLNYRDRASEIHTALVAWLEQKESALEQERLALGNAAATISQLQAENQQLKEQLAQLTQKPTLDYTGLYQALLDPSRGGAIYSRIIRIALGDNAVSTSLSVLGFALTASRDVEALKAALAMLDQSLQAVGMPFTAEEKQTWNLLAATHGLEEVVLA